MVDSKELSVAIGGIDVHLPTVILATCGISVESHWAEKVTTIIQFCSKLAETWYGGCLEILYSRGRINGQGYTNNDVFPEENIKFDESKMKEF